MDYREGENKKEIVGYHGKCCGAFVWLVGWLVATPPVSTPGFLQNARKDALELELE